MSCTVEEITLICSYRTRRLCVTEFGDGIGWRRELLDDDAGPGEVYFGGLGVGIGQVKLFHNCSALKPSKGGRVGHRFLSDLPRSGVPERESEAGVGVLAHAWYGDLRLS